MVKSREEDFTEVSDLKALFELEAMQMLDAEEDEGTPEEKLELEEELRWAGKHAAG